MQRCPRCRTYEPHAHPERLDKIPADHPIVFVCGTGDIAFADPQYIKVVLVHIRQYLKEHPFGQQTFLLQSKSPAVFEQYLPYLTAQFVLDTTLETNRDTGYIYISKAPKPSERWSAFKELAWPRKWLTIEPILEFDLEELAEMVLQVDPERAYIGYESSRRVRLPEPSVEKTLELMDRLERAGIEVVPKYIPKR
jgi:hypothetical protein